MTPRVLVLTGVGINSERELAECFALGGADPELVHCSRLAENPRLVLDYQVFALPGGFSYGDHVASGKILANFLRLTLAPVLDEVLRRRMPVLGICNGFQVLVKMGLLPRLGGAVTQELSLIHNDTGRYEDRWIRLGVSPEAQRSSPWLRGLAELRCPVRHGEGKLVAATPEAFAAFEKSGCAVLRYLGPDGTPAGAFPHNPNGSWGAVAGITDTSGLVFGLMPHPEVAVFRVQAPRSCREPGEAEHTACLGIFRNIVAHLRER